MSRGHELPVGPEPKPSTILVQGKPIDRWEDKPKRPTAEWHHGESGPVLREIGRKVYGREPTDLELAEGHAAYMHGLGSAPTWTAEPPTEEGLYWAHQGDDEFLVEVKRDTYGAKTLMVWFIGSEVEEVMPCRGYIDLWHPVPLTPPESP